MASPGALCARPSPYPPPETTYRPVHQARGEWQPVASAERDGPGTPDLLAAALAELGRTEEAKAAALQVLALDPSFSAARFCAAVGIPTALAEPMAEACPQLACRRSGHTERLWSPLQPLYQGWRLPGLVARRVRSNALGAPRPPGLSTISRVKLIRQCLGFADGTDRVAFRL